MLTGAFLRSKLSRVLGNADGRDGSPIKNDYSFLINRNILSHLGELDYNLLYTSNDTYMHQHHINNGTGNGYIALHLASALAIVH